MRTITVRELRQALEDVDQDAFVVFTSDYGDRSRTAQALPLRGEVEETLLVKSAYSTSGFALAESDEDADEDIDATGNRFIVIR